MNANERPSPDNRAPGADAPGRAAVSGHTMPAPRPQRSSLPVVVLKRLVRAWRRWKAARATRLELSTLDARMLRDLGIDRSEVGSVAAEIAGLAERTRALAMRP